jgi:hypothetical protein
MNKVVLKLKEPLQEQNCYDGEFMSGGYDVYQIVQVASGSYMLVSTKSGNRYINTTFSSSKELVNEFKTRGFKLLGNMIVTLEQL